MIPLAIADLTTTPLYSFACLKINTPLKVEFKCPRTGWEENGECEGSENHFNFDKNLKAFALFTVLLIDNTFSRMVRS